MIQTTLDQASEVQSGSLDYYLSLKYLVAIYPETNGFTVMIPDLPGCMSQGATVAEAMSNIDKARCLWVTTVFAKDENLIPLPSSC